eukprot:5307054-Pyramimonas_sp.AAC.1
MAGGSPSRQAQRASTAHSMAPYKLCASKGPRPDSIQRAPDTASPRITWETSWGAPFPLTAAFHDGSLAVLQD